MVRFSNLTAVAVALCLSGVEAGPCRPLTTSSGSTAITTLADATTTVLTESTASTTEAELTESASSIASDTTIASEAVTTTTTFAESTTILVESTASTAETDLTESASSIASEVVMTTTFAESTTTAQAESTTTTAAPACVETQVLGNPGFDDSNSDVTPWSITGGVLTQDSPQSGVNAVTYSFSNGGSGMVAQTVTNLEGTYEFSYYYRVVYVSENADYTCNIQLTVGDTSAYGEMEDNVGGWKTASIILSDLSAAQASLQFDLSCYGEYQHIQVNIDSLEFKRICSV